MPLTPHGKRMKARLIKEYGSKKGTSIFYAMINEGKITGAEGAKRRRKPRKKK